MQYAPLLHQNYIYFTCNNLDKFLDNFWPFWTLLNYFEVCSCSSKVHQRALLQIANLSKWPIINKNENLRFQRSAWPASKQRAKMKFNLSTQSFSSQKRQNWLLIPTSAEGKKTIWLFWVWIEQKQVLFLHKSWSLVYTTTTGHDN